MFVSCDILTQPEVMMEFNRNVTAVYQRVYQQYYGAFFAAGSTVWTDFHTT